MKLIIPAVIPLITAILISSCFSTYPSIREIQSDEAKYLNRNITVQGLVTDVQKFPFRKDGIYRIFDDDRNSIWVYKELGDLPKRGEKIRVTGKLRKKDDFRKKLLGPIIIENEK